MSRIGKKAIIIPDKIKVSFSGNLVKVEDSKGRKLEQEIDTRIKVEISNNQILLKRSSEEKNVVALHGLYRSLIQNMVTGLSTGFVKKLEIIGVGYKAEAKGDSLIFSLGYSHPIDFKLPKEVTAKVEEKNTRITLESYNRSVLGLIASKIRELRPPEPYKGKGIKYMDEKILRKVGKAGA